MAGNPMQMLMQMMTMGNNPQQIMQNMMMNNPQAKAVYNQMKASGQTPEQFVKQYAKQNNINIDGMLNMLRQRGF